MGESLNLLYPLDTFYAVSGRALPRAERVEPEQVPQPYHSLLVPQHDMTPTLEAFHGERIHLRVLERRLDENALWRLVDLILNGSETPVEFGAIVIYLRHFPERARDALLEGYRPLGSILADFAIPHSSCPQAFLRIHPDSYIADSLGIIDTAPLYGRRNNLLNADGSILADIIEILPRARS